MKKPVTITIETETDKKLRSIQAWLISNTNKNWSYSSIIHLLIDEGMKTFKKTSTKLSKK